MALHRNKLGPVGGGAAEGGTREGGIMVDLDPLSAFALMSRGSSDESKESRTAQGETPRQGVAKQPMTVGVGAVPFTAASRRERPSSATSPRPDTATLGKSGSIRRISNGEVPSPSQAPGVTSSTSGDARYNLRHGSQDFDRASMPAPSPKDRRAPSLSSPAVPRQALRESGPSNYASPSAGRAASNANVLEEKPSHDTSPERIDPLEILKAEGIECLDGELLLVKLQNASLEGLHGKMVPGILVMTTYKFLLIPYRLPRKGSPTHAAGAAPDDQRYLPFGHLPKEYSQVPMTCIDRVERDSDRKTSQRVDRYFTSDSAATIFCKDGRRLRVSFGGLEESERAMKMLQQLAFPGQMEHLFAFGHRNVDAGLPDPGWHIYDCRKEFDRMGVLKNRRGSASPWRTTDLNEKYTLCSSYPRVLVVPASVTDQEVEAVSQFRSEQRLPVLCWGRQADSASIWRSSQPKIGISRATCAEDEHMLARIAAISPSRVLPIVDCRPRSNATANFATGYGYESYADCPLEFAGIGNIHVMRESLAKLENLCLGGSAKDQEWGGAVEDTRWLSHTRTVISSAWTVAFKAHTQRTPVLVHCSHGWDRTSQVCSLAQMLLDPYYRTIDGFQVLIEKDWLAFGHPFHLRHAYGLPRGVTSGKEDQRSPIFLQFLDCTWQLVMQLPSYFEFNPRYLLCIADHIHSCRFGTFLCNTNKARRDAGLERRCASLWTYLEVHRPSFVSQLYHWDTREVLLPPLSSVLRHVRLWSDYFLRWSPVPSFTSLPVQLQGITVVGPSAGGATRAAHTRGPHPHPHPHPHQSDGHRSGRSRDVHCVDSMPIYRCEFDETERWVLMHMREADRWKRSEDGEGDEEGDAPAMQKARQGNSRASSGASRCSTGPKPPQHLYEAREEIERLRVELASKRTAQLYLCFVVEPNTVTVESTYDTRLSGMENKHQRKSCLIPASWENNCLDDSGQIIVDALVLCVDADVQDELVTLLLENGARSSSSAEAGASSDRTPRRTGRPGYKSIPQKVAPDDPSEKGPTVTPTQGDGAAEPPSAQLDLLDDDWSVARPGGSSSSAAEGGEAGEAASRGGEGELNFGEDRGRYLTTVETEDLDDDGKDVAVSQDLISWQWEPPKVMGDADAGASTAARFNEQEKQHEEGEERGQAPARAQAPSQARAQTPSSASKSRGLGLYGWH